MSVADLIPAFVAEVFELAGSFRAHGERIARTVGRTQSEWQLLSAASAGQKTVPQIARRLGFSRQAIQRTADQLVEEGLAVYQSNPDHKRSPYLELTDAGEKALGKITAAAVAWQGTIGKKVSRADAEHALKVIRALLMDLKPQ